MSSKLEHLFQKDWEWELRDNPEFACQAGQYDINGAKLLQDVTPASYDARVQHYRDVLDELALVEQEGFASKEQALFAKLFRLMHEAMIEAIQLCPSYLMPINCTAGGAVQNFMEAVEWMRFETEQDFTLYHQRLLAFPAQMEQYIAAMRHGLNIGVIASVSMMTGVEQQLEAILAGDLPELRQPLTLTVASTLPQSLRQDIETAINGTKDGYRSLLSFVRDEYRPRLIAAPGIGQLPNGNIMYQECLKYHTTTHLTPKEIHEIGLKEVANIERRYITDVLEPLGHTAADFDSFVESMRNDTKFYVSTPQQLIDTYKSLTNEINGIMPKYFKDIPASPLDIATKQGGPAAYYIAGTADGKRPGRFYVNVSHIEKRPLYETVALALHEAIPGHHHQLSLALENTRLPFFLRFVEDRRYEVCPCRRNLYTGYSEGWALYCEYLGEEMGMYKTPYDLFGRLSMDMMRAVRLVVDTGMHHLGWSTEKCIDYMMQKTGMHRHEVEVEIHRYAGWPGQACAYKIGQIEFLRLRRKAEDALGPKFDVRDFHAVCLMNGPLPLSVLDDLVSEYIAATA